MIVMANLVQIASLYMLQFLNLHSLAASTFWVTFFGVLWLVGIGVIVAIGIEISARTQYVLMGVQMISMFVFATWALIKAYTMHPSIAYPATTRPWSCTGPTCSSPSSAGTR